jgi:hypothetical protein
VRSYSVVLYGAPGEVELARDLSARVTEGDHANDLGLALGESFVACRLTEGL